MTECTKEILTVVRWMKQNAIDAAITSPTYYKWPNAYDGGNALLEHSSRLTGNYNVMRSDVILNKCLKDGFTWRDGLPGVYHGIVKREVLDKIYSKCNSYFPGHHQTLPIVLPYVWSQKSMVLLISLLL